MSEVWIRHIGAVSEQQSSNAAHLLSLESNFWVLAFKLRKSVLLGAVISIQPLPLEADSSWVHVFGIIVLGALQGTEAEAGCGGGSVPVVLRYRWYHTAEPRHV